MARETTLRNNLAQAQIQADAILNRQTQTQNLQNIIARLNQQQIIIPQNI